MLRSLLLLMCAVSLVPAQETSTPESLEFFERKIRPLLATHCYECHSAKSKKLQAGLRLDSRQAMLRGGDSGPAIVPGDAAESLLYTAVDYESFEMPPRGKLSQQEIDAVQKWIQLGAPWPKEPEPVPDNGPEEFDWEARAEAHWCWHPVQPVSPPDVDNTNWAWSPIDRFILAKLEEQGLVPAGDADRRTWIRRVYFDLIGLPPTPDQVASFLADSSGDAHANVVDELLKSEKFGEKWTRHWLDLVRYGETLGHEFDYPLHHAHRYRDYVIRAWNADVPYDQLVREHVAGDLLPQPRRNPENQINESVIGTGFWFLGEACHAPTDVKADEADRIDNQLDVFSKTFLAMTVACARCHDHKFDPISTADYYGLAGYLQSSRRQEALLDPHGAIRQSRKQLEELQAGMTASWEETRSSVDWSDDRVLAALQRRIESKDEEAVKALQSPTHPLFALAKLTTTAEFDTEREKLEDQLENLKRRAEASLVETTPFVDFSEDDLAGWYFTGEAFGEAPSVKAGWQRVEGLGPFAEDAVHSGRLSGRLQGVLRSPTFVLPGKRVHYKINGRGAKIRLIVDGYTMDEFNALLFRGMQQKVDTKGESKWVTQSADVYHYVGHRAHIEVIDHGDGFAALEEIRFSDEAQPRDPPHPLNLAVLRGQPANADAVRASYLKELRAAWQRISADAAQPGDRRLGNWLVESGAVPLPAAVIPWEEQMAAVDAEIPSPTPVIALADGDAENEYVFIRGNHRNQGPEAPRQLPVAIGGVRQPVPDGGSGRLALAQRMTDPANPLTSRVMVNRLWHHLFGRGIVPTVDDFGKMGQLPSHPELLDWLADDFVHQQGWSLKQTIRQIVLSRTYRMSSQSESSAELVARVDPKNVLLHRAPIRRLTGESIRDALLQLSGQLDETLYGPSVPVHLTPFMEGRGRPGRSGPLDGDKRRSLYIEVRRNFLTPMMMTFDRPSPFSSMGRRSISNVPAQSLMLMNDPFVTEQTRLWARRLMAEPGADRRIERAFEMAFSRPPTPQQRQYCEAFVAAQGGGEQAWADLCHMLVNMKPFIFVN